MERAAYPRLALWSGGHPAAGVDAWFLHAFADSHDSFAGAFSASIAKRLRIFAFDLPGHGASAALPAGLTIEDAARGWRDAIAFISASRPVVLVAHSMAAIIATATARLLPRPPELVVSVEGNLTPADAYFTGQAAGFAAPEDFHVHFQQGILEMSSREQSLQRYLDNVRRTDPRTIWTLGHSVVAHATPGLDFLRLECPAIYYWDPLAASEGSKRFIAEHDLRHRKLEGLGHWPMVKAPQTFYAALEQDILACTTGDP